MFFQQQPNSFSFHMIFSFLIGNFYNAWLELPWKRKKFRGKQAKSLIMQNSTFGSRFSVWWIESESDLSFSQLMVCHPRPSYFDRSLCSLDPPKIQNPELHFLPACSTLVINYTSLKLVVRGTPHSEKLPNLSIGTMWGGSLSLFQ